MTSIGRSRRSKLWLYVPLILVLLGCLWIGWRDFDPWVSREEIRENIRSNIRWAVQVLVQYVIPGAIFIFFGKEAIAKLHGEKRTSSHEA
jgi:hypothetical protein